jgi:GT2 family glycosyltransferase
VEGAPQATVVVVSRDRWSIAPATLDLLLERTDPRHSVVVVDGRSPRRVAASFDRLAASGRIRVARRGRHLASNEARNIGADGATTEWIAFVENDSVLSDGWLETLLEVGEARGAASVYPVYLEPGPGSPVVHGLGADLEVGGPPGARLLREHQFHIGRPWHEVADEIAPVARVQAEPHAMVIRRGVLEQLGGLDEGLLSWFDHTDLALHHQQLGIEAWLVPEVTCLYLTPPPVAFQDVPSFLLRWSRDWFARSRDRLCQVWDLDHKGAAWIEHARYGASVRRSVLTPWARVNAVIDHATQPAERLVGRWNERAS